MPLNISVVIPHFQKQDVLQKTWDELQLQIHPDDQIIIVDDHSPDGVPDFDCPCTEVIRPPKLTPHIYRLCTLRNYGIQHAKHDTIIILDPDCVPNPKFLDNARKMSDASVLFGGCVDKVQKDGSIKPDTRRNVGKSYWCDLRDKGGSTIWGGVMMFSKSRTKLIGWFDEAYNGAWGVEENDFASKCYQSGMRLRYSMELKITHQYHPEDTTGYERNRALLEERQYVYRKYLGTFTPYNPAVGVMVVTAFLPELIDRRLRRVFRNRLPLKVRLINNGDEGEDTRRMCVEWGRRWAVDYVNHPSKTHGEIRNDSLLWAKQNRLKYLILIDDDTTHIFGSITALISEMESNNDVDFGNEPTKQGLRALVVGKTDYGT